MSRAAAQRGRVTYEIPGWSGERGREMTRSADMLYSAEHKANRPVRGVVRTAKGHFGIPRALAPAAPWIDDSVW